MRRLIIILFCLPRFLFSQEVIVSSDSANNNSDSVKVEKEKSFFNSGWKKHNHIIDFIWTTGVFRFDSQDGALGYRYLYNTKWRYSVKFGARVGIWGRKSSSDLPLTQHRNYFTYSVSGIINIPLWKSFNLEIAPGISSELFWPKESNNLDQKGVHTGTTFFNQKIGFNSIFYSHFCLDFGIRFIYDKQPNIWYFGGYIGLGYKF